MSDRTEAQPAADTAPAESAASLPPLDPASTRVAGPADAARAAALSEDAAPPGYQILRVLGRGGMGVVYAARQTDLGRAVALKMVLAGGHASDADTARFEAEAAAVAAVVHPNVVPVFHAGRHRGLPFYAMEYLPGGSLADALATGPLPPGTAARVAEQTARGVAAAHAAGILHRDLKPQNVLLAADGTPKVADFGLAKRLTDTDGPTRTGSVLGTPGYMAPEQAGGRSKAVGPAADVYGLGAVLYQCLTGRPPFQAPTWQETVRQVLDADPVPVRQLQPGVPRDLETITLKCLAKEPGRRYAGAAEFADDLARWANREPIRARPAGAGERAAKWVARHRTQTAAAAAVFAALAAGLAASLWQAAKADAARAVAVERERDAAAEAANARAAEGRAVAARADAEAEAARAKAQTHEADRQRVRAEKVTGLMAGLFAASDPVGIVDHTSALNRITGDRLAAPDLLRRAAGHVRAAPDLDPPTRLAMLARIGVALLQQGDPDAGEPLILEAAAVAAGLPADGPEAGEAAHFLGFLHEFRGRYRQAEAAYRTALAVRERLARDAGTTAARLELAQTEVNLALLVAQAERYEEAEALAARAHRTRTDLLGPDARLTLVAQFAVGVCQVGQPGLVKKPQGLLTSEDALRRLVRLEGDDTAARAIVAFQEGVVAVTLFRDYRGGLAKVRAALAGVERLVGRNHPYYLLVLCNLAAYAADAGDPGALDLMTAAVDLARRLRFLTHPQLRTLYLRLFETLAAAGRLAEAGPRADEWLAAHAAADPGSVYHAEALILCGQVDLALGAARRAADRLDRAAAVLAGYPDADRRPASRGGAAVAAQAARAEGRFADAVRHARRFLAADAKWGADGPTRRQTQFELGFALAQTGDAGEEAEGLLAAAARRPDRGTWPKAWVRFWAAAGLADVYRTHRDWPRARAVAADAERAAAAPDQWFAAAARHARLATVDPEPHPERAVAILKRAVSEGFRNAAVVRAEPGFAPMLDRPDVRALLDRMSAPREQTPRPRVVK